MKIFRTSLYLLVALLAVACTDHEPQSASMAFERACNKKIDPYCEIEKFEQLPIQNKLKAASAVLMTKNKIEGNEIKEYVDQVLKLEPGITLYMKPGTLVKTHPNLPNTSYGDGSITILRGSPATSVESYSYENGMISGLGNMPVSELKRILGTP